MRVGFMGRLAVVAFGIAAASGATAATLNEAALAGGRFGGLWSAPTEVGAGFDTIRGTGEQNVYDNFVFTGLPSGAQTLSFRFSAPDGYDHSYSAGGTILYSDRPFRWGWDGTTAGTVQVDYHRPAGDYLLGLGDSFSGNLYLALNFTHGSKLAYTISAPSNATTSPVPLPAGALLIVSGTAALAAAGLRRRPAAA
jgi:hypothetical protein